MPFCGVSSTVPERGVTSCGVVQGRGVTFIEVACTCGTVPDVCVKFCDVPVPFCSVSSTVPERGVTSCGVVQVVGFVGVKHEC